jgi:hypothetical protein
MSGTNLIEMKRTILWMGVLFCLAGPAFADQTPAITSPASAQGTVGQPFTYQITATNNPTSYGMGGTLPAGLSLDYGTGLISGTPTAASPPGGVVISVGAFNASGTSSMIVTLTIISASPGQAAISTPATPPPQASISTSSPMTRATKPAAN